MRCGQRLPGWLVWLLLHSTMALNFMHAARAASSVQKRVSSNAWGRRWYHPWQIYEYVSLQQNNINLILKSQSHPVILFIAVRWHNVWCVHSRAFVRMNKWTAFVQTNLRGLSKVHHFINSLITSPYFFSFPLSSSTSTPQNGPIARLKMHIYRDFRTEYRLRHIELQ